MMRKVLRKKLRSRSYVDRSVELPFPRLISPSDVSQKVVIKTTPAFEPTWFQRLCGMRPYPKVKQEVPYTHYGFCIIQFSGYVAPGTIFEGLEFKDAIYYGVKVEEYYACKKAWTYFCSVKSITPKAAQTPEAS